MMIALSLMSMMEYLVAGNYLMNTLFLLAVLLVAYGQLTINMQILTVYQEIFYYFFLMVVIRILILSTMQNGLKIHMENNITQ